MRHSLIASLFLLSSLYCTAQDQEVQIKQTVNYLFTSMKSSDAEGLYSIFMENATLKSIIKDSTGVTRIVDEKISDFASSVAKLPKGYVDERISFETIKIDGDMAFVWAPYDLYIDGKFKHCGVDAFTLIKRKDKWKILSLVDTRRKNGCKIS